MRFAFIEAKKAEYPVSALCRVLEVERSGFYAWRSREESDHAVDDRRLAVEVRAAFEESKRRYGSPRVYRVLRRQGVMVGRHRVARLMQEQKLPACEPFEARGYMLFGEGALEIGRHPRRSFVALRASFVPSW